MVDLLYSPQEGDLQQQQQQQYIDNLSKCRVFETLLQRLDVQ